MFQFTHHVTRGELEHCAHTYMENAVVECSTPGVDREQSNRHSRGLYSLIDAVRFQITLQ